MAIKKLFIANRGEIAVRIIRAAQALGIRTVQAASEADKDMLACRLADEVALVGPPQATQSYLNIDAVMGAVRASGADAVHPGYGFLSENPRFVEAVEQAGVVFVGPTAATMRAMGDKARARAEAIAAHVPVVQGSDGCFAGLAEARRIAERIKYPLMVKASAGGGGRGIRVITGPELLDTMVSTAMAEARAAFGDDRLYMERYVGRARHIEVQVLGDGNDVIHLFERECSLQRKRQKVWEEGPAACLPDDTRKALHSSAVALARRVRYRGAGTLEYLYDDATDEFYFIEMNTRIQVEHPVTELITGIDLVQAQLRIAGDEALWLRQTDLSRAGHAIEVRINAENPAKGFMPSPGTVTRYQAPQSGDVRFDTLLYEGYRVPPYYDSLIGKLIVHGADRQSALSKLRAALDDLTIQGIYTTIPMLRALARDPDVQQGAVHTAWLENWMQRQTPDQQRTLERA